MNSYSYSNLEQSFLCEVSNISKNGLQVSSRGMLSKEVLFRSISIDDPTDLQIGYSLRKFSPLYAIGEFLWYLSGTKESKNIGKLAQMWLKISDENGEVESNYGTYLKPQWDWVINELSNSKDSRRATFTINQPHHKSANSLDYPCTMYLQFLVRDNKLHLHVSMRSNDAVYGYCNDVFNFCLFQQLMLNELNSRGANIELGRYYHTAGSFHIYEKHFEMMEKICESQIQFGDSYEVKHERFWKLNPWITMNYIMNENLSMPTQDMSKEELNNLSKTFIKRAFQ